MTSEQSMALLKQGRMQHPTVQEGQCSFSCIPFMALSQHSEPSGHRCEPIVAGSGWSMPARVVAAHHNTVSQSQPIPSQSGVCLEQQ